jgi:HSP20 family molecular chaperone IbpA
MAVSVYQRRMNDLFDTMNHDFARGMFDDPFSNWSKAVATPGASSCAIANFCNCAFKASMDVVEHDKDFVVSLDIPGVNKDELKIEVQDNMLSVSGERKHEHKV